MIENLLIDASTVKSSDIFLPTVPHLKLQAVVDVAAITQPEVAPAMQPVALTANVLTLNTARTQPLITLALLSPSMRNNRKSL